MKGNRSTGKSPSDLFREIDGLCEEIDLAIPDSDREAGEKIKGGDSMPTISIFYGILIRMFFRDTDKHHVPHIHADYQGQVAVYSIPDGSLLAGALPPNKHKLVLAWIEIHQEDLLADWSLAVNGNKPLPIKGLDQ